MHSIKYILVNESYSQYAVLAIRNSRVSDFRHSHIISAAGLSRPELISVLLLARKQWPLPRSWAYPSWDLKSETSESYLAADFVPAMP